MRKILQNQKGISLVELVVSIPLALLVILILSIVLINFVTTYQEVKLYLELQENLFNTLEMIRYGYVYEPFTDSPSDDPQNKRPIIGLMTANEIDLGIHPHSISLYQEGGYRADYYAADGKIFLNLSNPNWSETGIQIFPPDDINNEEVGNDQRFEIIDYSLFSVEQGSLEKPEIINVRLKGRVRFRAREQGQTVESDIRMNTKTIQYQALVYLENLK
jgi:hypothetical protein